MFISGNELLFVENKLKNIVPMEVEFRPPKCNKNPRIIVPVIILLLTLKIDTLLLQINYRLPFPVRLSK